MLDQYSPALRAALRSQVDLECKQFETLSFVVILKGDGVVLGCNGSFGAVSNTFNWKGMQYQRRHGSNIPAGLL